MIVRVSLFYRSLSPPPQLLRVSGVEGLVDIRCCLKVEGCPATRHNGPGLAPKEPRGSGLVCLLCSGMKNEGLSFSRAKVGAHVTLGSLAGRQSARKPARPSGPCTLAPGFLAVNKCLVIGSEHSLHPVAQHSACHCHQSGLCPRTAEFPTSMNHCRCPHSANKALPSGQGTT